MPLSEKRRAYMRDYVKRNKKELNEYRRRNRDKINASKRLAYRSRPDVREYYKQNAKAYRVNNPTRRRSAELLSRYGLTLAEYKEKIERQGGTCAICKGELDRTPHVDHCHNSGRVRGILCSSCNLGIGKFKDDPDALRAAAAYIESHLEDTHAAA